MKPVQKRRGKSKNIEENKASIGVEANGPLITGKFIDV